MPSTLSASLKQKIEARQANVAVIGMGYVGLPLALLYIGQKFPVTGFDIDRRKVQLHDPLKKLGEFTVPVKLHRDVTVTLKVKVVSEGGQKS